MRSGLSKSKYLAGLQCLKRLWLEVHHPEHLFISLSQNHTTQQGIQVGRIAQTYFSEGELITADHTNLNLALHQTNLALQQQVNCLFEATFVSDRLLVRCDILRRYSGETWELIEVKASTQLKPEYLDDLAVQLHVLKQNSLNIANIQVMHLNRECVYPDLSNLFIRVNVTSEVEARLQDVQSQLEQFKQVIAQPEEPNILVGTHCQEPNLCPFKNYCWQDVPKQSIFTIPLLSTHKATELVKSGILHVQDLQVDYPLTAKQQRYVTAVINNEVDINTTAIQQELSRLQYPLHFLDFETDSPAIPRFAGFRPYELFPFQYSCHSLHTDGTIQHHEYLHLDETDPRPAFVESLLAHIPAQGSVIAYNASFERTVLKRLAIAFPAYAAALNAISDRLWDQLVIFKNYYHHPDFLGSNSLKSVLPVLVPKLSYQSLTIQDGSSAQALWNIMIRESSDHQKNQIADELRAYCQLDTLAMLKIHYVLAAI
jgi:hypothetical protein